MAESLNDAVTWVLPSRFLSGDRNAPAPAQKKDPKSTDLRLNPSLVFPTGFPYEFESLDSALSSPVGSVLGSTETETTTSDEEDFLAGLTQRLTHSSSRKLEKNWVLAGSPESTLTELVSMSVSSNGSPNGSSSLVSSPPTTPFGDQHSTWDLISAAAGQIARLKMNNCAETVPRYATSSHARGLLAPPKSLSPVHVIKNPNFGFYTRQSVNFDLAANTNQYQQYVKQQEQMLKVQSQRQQVMRQTWESLQPHQIQSKAKNFGQLPPSAWPPLQVQHHKQKPQQQRRPVFVAGTGCVKRECAGTGVFLPRRYGSNNDNLHDSRRKSGSSNVYVPTMNGHVQQRFNSSFCPNFDATIARRNALNTLQKRSLRAEAARNHHEIHLPKEWTY